MTTPTALSFLFANTTSGLPSPLRSAITSDCGSSPRPVSTFGRYETPVRRNRGSSFSMVERGNTQSSLRDAKSRERLFETHGARPSSFAQIGLAADLSKQVRRPLETPQPFQNQRPIPRQATAKFAVFSQSGDSIGKLVDVARLIMQSPDAVAHLLGQSINRSRDQRQPERHRLLRYTRIALDARGTDEHIGRHEISRHIRRLGNKLRSTRLRRCRFGHLLPI